MATMLKDVIPLEQAISAYIDGSARKTVICTLNKFIEKHTGTSVLFERPLEHSGLEDAYTVMKALFDARILTTFRQRTPFPDEPLFYTWIAEFSADKARRASGLSSIHPSFAAIPALAETLERYLWYGVTDYFQSPRTFTVQDATRNRIRIIKPDSFAGYSTAQRHLNPSLHLDENSAFLWIYANSLISGSRVYIPAQIVSAAYDKNIRIKTHETSIRMPVTTGLATHPDPTLASIHGILEIIERDAYMLMWLNQLSMPRVDPYILAKDNLVLYDLLQRCKRHRLLISAVRLLSDAPAHVLCAVVEDPEHVGSMITIGIKAHSSASIALEGALLEALRGRVSVRTLNKTPEDIKNMQIGSLTLRNRLAYWQIPERAARLAFMRKGEIKNLERTVWDDLSGSAYLTKLLDWATENNYEVLRVDMGRSLSNPLPWNVHMIVMPDLQPMHLDDTLPFVGGSRIKEIPRRFGYTPRNVPFTSEPHPFD